MKRLLTIIWLILLTLVNMQAQEMSTNDDDTKIYRLVMTVSHNHGDTFGFSLPISDCPFADLTQQKTTSLTISLISVMATADVTDVTFCATMYNTSIGHTSSDEWREIKLEKNKFGQWELNSGDGIELIEQEWLSENNTHTFEFYIKAKCAEKSVFYNNGGQNYKWTFTTGEGHGDTWRIKFPKDKKASMSMSVGPFIGPLKYIFTGETERTSNEPLGLINSMTINRFGVYFIRNDNVDIKSVSMLYKVYEKGLNADWKRLNANQYLEQMIFNEETLHYESHMCYEVYPPVECNVTEGLTPGKEYVLEIMFQVVDTENNCYTILQDEACSRFQFSFIEENAYRPFIEEGKVWRTGVTYPNIYFEHLYDYYIKGDTIIDNHVCKKFMQSELQYLQYDFYHKDTTYVASLYEEGQRVYVVWPGSSNFELVYDFASPVGSHIDMDGSDIIVTRKEECATECFKGNCTYVALAEEHEHYPLEPCWMEGVGIDLFPLYSLFRLKLTGLRQECLICCLVNDEVLYFDQELAEKITPDNSSQVKKQWLDFTHIRKPRPKAPRKGIEDITRSESSENEETLTGEYSIKDLFVNFKPLSGAYMITVTDANDQEVYHKEVQTNNVIAFNTALSTYSKGSYTLTVENAEEAYTATFILGDKTAVRDIPAQHILNSKSSNRTWYDLSGRRLMMPHAKGIYIRDGRKIVVK